jgi:hypothetical protein
MKSQLIFELPEEQEAFDDAVNGTKYKDQIEEIWQRVFRPAYKHGYSHERLNELANSEEGYELIGLLADIYRDIVNDE